MLFLHWFQTKTQPIRVNSIRFNAINSDSSTSWMRPAALRIARLHPLFWNRATTIQAACTKSWHNETNCIDYESINKMYKIYKIYKIYKMYNI